MVLLSQCNNDQYWQYCLSAAMITRWRYCLNAVMINRSQYCLSAAMITRWRYCLNSVTFNRWQYCLRAATITRWRPCLIAVRAVDNALTLFRVWRHFRSCECCSVRITCTVAANISHYNFSNANLRTF